VTEQLDIPLTTADGFPLDVVVKVVRDPKTNRLRVTPLAFSGWVRFPRKPRRLGALFVVDELHPLPGGAWAAVGKIRRLRRRS
jgi:hypothetical protein